MTRLEACQVESAWIRDRALSVQRVDDATRAVYAYALRLCRVRHIRAAGQKMDTAPILGELRDRILDGIWMLADFAHGIEASESYNSTGTLAPSAHWLSRDINAFYPQMAAMLGEAVSRFESAGIPREALEAELREKKLVLALGGGGGTGFVHLSLFQWLEECGIQPALITGTSIGALLGYVRALQDHYDAALTTLKLPSYWRLSQSIRPCFDTTHGLVGLCQIDLSRTFDAISQAFGWVSMPEFHELRIPFACVASGIVQAPGVRELVEPKGGTGFLRGILQMTKLGWQRGIRHAASIAGLLTSNNAVRPVVFGFDRLTERLPALDGISFSMLVPGVLNFELPQNHYKSREILDQIFKDNDLYRLADGGLASNVPVRAALGAVSNGRIGTENVYVLGIDVFAPQPSDGLFYPLQKIANANVHDDARHADVVVRPDYLLSPMNLSPTLGQLRSLNTKFRKDFAPEMKILQYALKPLWPLVV